MTTPRWTSAAAAVAAAALLLFPVLRPWPDETVASAGLATAFASDRWVVAHLCGILGLGLLAPVVLGVRALLRGAGRRTRAATAALVAAWLGAGLSAMYFGAEIFGIRTLAQAALDRGDLTLLDEVEVLRMQPAAVTVFGAGLILVAATGVLTAVALWWAGRTARWAGVLVGAGLVLFLPQFFGPPALRVAHGVLLAVGLALLARAARTLAMPVRR
jgi:hypothetical protein